MLNDVNKIHSFLFFTVICFFFLGQAVAQDEGSDSSFYSSSIKNIRNYYWESVHKNSPLYKGKIYVGHSVRIIGHPFFESESVSEGTVVYDGIHYQAVPMFLDLVREEVVIDLENGFKIKLINEKVEKFSLFGHTFIRLEENEISDPKVSPGIYDVLYEGNVLLLAKRSKEIKEYIENSKSIKEFVPRIVFFIRKGESFYSVKSKQSVLRLFKDQKKSIRKYLKKNRIKYNSDPEEAIVKILKYTEQLSN